MGEDPEPPVNTGVSWPADLDQAGMRVRKMQAKLYLWATRDPGRVFNDLFNLVYDPAFLVHAWDRVRNNTGGRTAGVDGLVPKTLPSYPVEFLETIRAQVKERRFRPLPVRERLIPKPGGAKKRRLGIPTTADRVVQAALKLALEPIFEADFKPMSYGFRPKRRAQDAIAEIHHFSSQGYHWVLEADIEACFDEIDHTALMDRVRGRVEDKRVLALVKAFLKAGVLSEEGITRETHTGTPQGGILSPLLANIALSVLDEHFHNRWEAFGVGTKFPGQRRKRYRAKGGATYKLVRYADDFVVLVHGTQRHAEQLRGEVAQILTPMGLRLSEEKTGVCHIDEGFDFLGWRIQRRGKAGTNREVIYTYPSKKSLKSITSKIRTITHRSAYRSLEQLLRHLNMVVRGWCNYFRHGVSSATYRYLYLFMWNRVVKWLLKRHPKLNWKQIRRRYLTGYPAHRPAGNGTVLFNPQEIVIERYSWRGYTIPTPWDGWLNHWTRTQQA
ncbi:group II intron reverse transcriptase/maturase [Actinopolymorpha alba]|uniref:group II intron reverse transcriptase/maturase n=1 Tax=Actinopolymorpha alba TaxID=533267 RepID=UPI0003725C2A|nr:group II intron reverse transcriptase/maturase [Actinopolymorpha alba]